MVELSRQENGTDVTASFARAVAEGLSRKQKRLPSRYFYDGRGSQLFQQIMDLPEYYLTRSEYEVLNENKSDMAAQFASDGFFHLVDLGAGDALKTKILLRELSRQQRAFDYVPVDISGDAMLQLSESLSEELPQLKVEAVVGEYAEALAWLQENKQERKVLLFLGSNIGNFEAPESMEFLKMLRGYLQPGDRLLMGADLRKDPATILQAYDDRAGITAEFNLNLLHRINRELGGNFDVDQFYHYAIYNPGEGVMRSFLVSKKEQDVFIRDTEQSFHFDAWEAIHTENSHKYSLPQIAELGESCGFKMETAFFDSQKRFADVLFTVS